MLLNLLVFINVIIFILLSGMHFYWAFGGRWALMYTVPEKYSSGFSSMDGNFKLKLATIIVALGLLLFAYITASHLELTPLIIEKRLIKIATGIIGGIFLMRAIGDFDCCGLFKKDKNGIFAEKDSLLYIPLCLLISVVSFLLVWME